MGLEFRLSWCLTGQDNLVSRLCALHCVLCILSFQRLFLGWLERILNLKRKLISYPMSGRLGQGWYSGSQSTSKVLQNAGNTFAVCSERPCFHC